MSNHGALSDEFPGWYFHLTGELEIHLPALKKPTLEELQEKHDWIKHIDRDSSTEEPVIFTLATVLVPSDGDCIYGWQYEERIVSKHNSLLGFQHRRWLLEHEDEFPAFKAYLGNVAITFPGLVACNSDTGRGVPSCNRVDDPGGQEWFWLGDKFRLRSRIACSQY